MELTITLRNRNGNKRTVLLDAQPVPRSASRQFPGEITGGLDTPVRGPRGATVGAAVSSTELFLGLFEILSTDLDRVEFLDIQWRGISDLFVVDLSIIRP